MMEALFPLATLAVGWFLSRWFSRVRNMELRFLADEADSRCARAEERAEQWKALAESTAKRLGRAEEAIKPLQRQLREADHLLRELA